ncbi:hypothetical protein ACA910_014189 [Epithemia clementina (nom. ined.)]
MMMLPRSNTQHQKSRFTRAVACLLLILSCNIVTRTEALLFGVRRRSTLPISLISKLQDQQQHQFYHPVNNAAPLQDTGSRIYASSLTSNEGSPSSSSALTDTPNGAGASMATSTTKGATRHQLKPWQSTLIRIGMMSYIVGMCVALPLTLIPQKLMYKMGVMTKEQKEHYAVATSAFCARWLLRLIPFCRVTIYPYHHPNPVESVWVCNHSSLLDIFIMLACDRQLRGSTRRPIKTVYWKELEKNPICNLLFKQAGFIPVQMAANKAGEDNDYDKSSFKRLLKDSKQAFKDGFDMGILPEGQLNPTPEKGLLPVFSGAFTLARMSRRPIQMMAMNGAPDLWHPMHGMHCIGRHVKLRAYPYTFRFANSTDFVDTFKTIVGHFALYGQDLSEEDLNNLLCKILTSSANSNK